MTQRSAGELFFSGEEFFRKGLYVDAEKLIHAAREQGLQSAWLYYYLSKISYFQSDHLASSKYAFRAICRNRGFRLGIIQFGVSVRNIYWSNADIEINTDKLDDLVQEKLDLFGVVWIKKLISELINASQYHAALHLIGVVKLDFKETLSVHSLEQIKQSLKAVDNNWKSLDVEDNSTKGNVEQILKRANYAAELGDELRPIKLIQQAALIAGWAKPMELELEFRKAPIIGSLIGWRNLFQLVKKDNPLNILTVSDDDGAFACWAYLFYSHLSNKNILAINFSKGHFFDRNVIKLKAGKTIDVQTRKHNEVLSGINKESVNIIYLGCNVDSNHLSKTLNKFWSALSPGGVFIIEHYNNLHLPNIKSIVDEFLLQYKREIAERHITYQICIIKNNRIFDKTTDATEL